MTRTARLESWGCLEMRGHLKLLGLIYDDSLGKFADGTDVTTSTVCAVNGSELFRKSNIVEGCVITTRSGSFYTLGKIASALQPPGGPPVPNADADDPAVFNPPCPPLDGKVGADIVEAPPAAVPWVTMSDQEFFGCLGTDGPNAHDEGPEPRIRESQDKVFMHLGTGVLYQVRGWGWDAQRDRWLMRYVRYYLVKGTAPVNNVNYHHLPEDFFQKGRFLEVKA